MSQVLSTQSYPGTRDFYPRDMQYRQYMFSLISKAVESFSYKRISAPLLESFEIFAAKSGEEIAGEQLYVFEDKGSRKVAIRPEFTPSLARMFAAKINELPNIQRWFSIENFMRYERPQKGRLREFCQINVDLIGAEGSFADFEILRVAKSLFDVFGANSDMYEIRVNHKLFLEEILLQKIGLSSEHLADIFKLLDKKHKITKEVFDTSLKDLGLSNDKIAEFHDMIAMNFEELLEINGTSQSANDLKEVFTLANEIFGSNNPLVFDISVVRGLAYYTGIVFEAYDKTTSSRALFGGGRYDNLISLFSNKSSVSGIGFAIGDVTFEMFLRHHNLLSDNSLLEDQHLIAVDASLPLAQFHRIRDCLLEMQTVLQECISMCLDIPNLVSENYQKQCAQILQLINNNPFFDKDMFSDNSMMTFFTQAKNKQYGIEIYPDPAIPLGKQLQYANKSGISYVWICGSPEIQRGIIKRKNMKTGKENEFSLSTFESL